MHLEFQKIKSPDGVEDSAVIVFNDRLHFIASLGTEIQIFDGCEQVAAFIPKYKITKILPYHNHYFLIGHSGYFVYQNLELLSEHSFPQVFSCIYKIIIYKTSFIIVHDCRKFTLGKVTNYRLEFEKGPNDNHYYEVLSGCSILDRAILLVSTNSKKYILGFDIEGVSNVKLSKRDIQTGCVVVGRKDDILVFDEQGMWQLSTKMTFIKEFANYKITNFYNDENNRAIVFCMNGEVIAIESDYTHYTLGYLDSAITHVSKIGDMFFCTSLSFSYFLKFTENICIISKFGSSKSNCNLSVYKSSKYSFGCEIISNSSISTIQYLICSNVVHNNENIENTSKPEIYLKKHKEIKNNGEIINNSLTNTNRIEKQAFITLFSTFLKTVVASKFNYSHCISIDCEFILNFDNFSIFRGISTDPILDAFKYKTKVFISTFEKLLIVENTTILCVNMQSLMTKFVDNFAIFISTRNINIIDLSTMKHVTVQAPTNICDCIIKQDILYCIDINENLYCIEINENFVDLETRTGTIDDIKQHVSLEVDLLASECKILSKEVEDNLKNISTAQNIDQCLSPNIKNFMEDEKTEDHVFLNVNGKIIAVVDKKKLQLVDLNRFIYKIVQVKNFLVISAGYTFLYNLHTKEILRIAFDSTWSFWCGCDLFLCSGSAVNCVDSFEGHFKCTNINYDFDRESKLIAIIKDSPLYGTLSLDCKDYKICYKEHSITVKNKVYIASCRIKTNLACVAFANINNKGGCVMFITIKRNKIKTVHKFNTQDYPLSVISNSNRISVATVDSFLLYKLKNMKCVKKLKLKNDNLIKSTQFISKDELIVRNHDWSYSKVNFANKEIKTISTDGYSIPFVIDGVDGYCIGSKLMISGLVIDCLESITDIYTLGKYVIIVGGNGSIFQLENNRNSDMAKSFYDTIPNVTFK